MFSRVCLESIQPIRLFLKQTVASSRNWILQSYIKILKFYQEIANWIDEFHFGKKAMHEDSGRKIFCSLLLSGESVITIVITEFTNHPPISDPNIFISELAINNKFSLWSGWANETLYKPKYPPHSLLLFPKDCGNTAAAKVMVVPIVF